MSRLVVLLSYRVWRSYLISKNGNYEGKKKNVMIIGAGGTGNGDNLILQTLFADELVAAGYTALAGVAGVHGFRRGKGGVHQGAVRREAGRHPRRRHHQSQGDPGRAGVQQRQTCRSRSSQGAGGPGEHDGSYRSADPGCSERHHRRNFDSH